MAVALEIEIRLLRPADAPRVADLLAVAFTEEFEGAGSELQGLHRQLRAGGWAQREPWRSLASLIGVEFAFFVAEHRGLVVGCAGIIGQQLPVVNSVAVRPEFRRLGIAAALVREVESFAAERGHDRVTLDVLAHNTPALELYRRLGYEEYHRYRTYARPCSEDPAAPALPDGYRLEPPRLARPGDFEAIEHEALPERFCQVAPSLRQRYVSGAPAVLHRLLAGARTYRRTVLHDGAVIGFLSAHLAIGQREGRIEYPILPPDHGSALPGALAHATSFLADAGATAARVDLSDDRPDHHAAVEAMGFVHRWTFIQMYKRLMRGTRIPVRVGGERPAAERDET
jgi:GNAT superfamily N-acetyltransferase